MIPGTPPPRRGVPPALDSKDDEDAVIVTSDARVPAPAPAVDAAPGALPAYMRFSTYDKSPFSEEEGEDKKKKLKLPQDYAGRLSKLKLYQADGKLIATLEFRPRGMTDAEIASLKSDKGLEEVSPTGLVTRFYEKADAFEGVLPKEWEQAERADLTPEQNRQMRMITMMSVVMWVRLHSNSQLEFSSEDPHILAVSVAFAAALNDRGIKCVTKPPVSEMRANKPTEYAEAEKLVREVLQAANLIVKEAPRGAAAGAPTVDVNLIDSRFFTMLKDRFAGAGAGPVGAAADDDSDADSDAEDARNAPPTPTATARR